MKLRCESVGSNTATNGSCTGCRQGQLLWRCPREGEEVSCPESPRQKSPRSICSSKEGIQTFLVIQ